MRFTSKPWRLAAVAAAATLVLAACGGEGESDEASGETIKIGMIVSETGTFTTQAKDFDNGFRAALEHLTDGTMEVAGHKLEILKGDDAGEASVGTAKAKEFLGEGAQILTGPTDSAVATAVADQALQNNALYIAGTSGTTAFVGMDKRAFGTSGGSPAGQMILPHLMGGTEGKTLATIDQDYAYGQSVVEALKGQLEPEGTTIESYLLPTSTTDFTPTMLKLKQSKPDFVLTSWAGPGSNQLLSALASQGILKDSTFLQFLLLSQGFAPIGEALGDAVDDAVFYASYFPGVTGNEADEALQAYSKEHDHKVEYDDAVGWNAAAMIIHAIEQGGTDTDAMAEALQGHSFEGPAGTVTIRAEDNQVTVPQFTVRLVESDGEWSLEKVDEFTAEDLEPPVVNPLD